MTNETMGLTPYADVNALLDALVAGAKTTLGDKLVGFYLYGSLIWGGFEHDVSDIDTLAAVSAPVTGAELERLRTMHDGIAQSFPSWSDRVEVQYQSLEGLRTFRDRHSPMAVISPGEPMHIVEAGPEWLLNWYFVRAYGITLFGPPPETIIDTITKQEFIDGVRDHALEWRNYIAGTRGSRSYQGYAILTLCRAWYTLTHGEQVSKRQAALWMMQRVPEHATLIDEALQWRERYRDGDADPAQTYPAARGFVLDMVDRIEAMGRGMVR